MTQARVSRKGCIFNSVLCFYLLFCWVHTYEINKFWVCWRAIICMHHSDSPFTFHALRLFLHTLYFRLFHILKWGHSPVVPSFLLSHQSLAMCCYWEETNVHLRDRLYDNIFISFISNPFSTRPHQNVVWYNNSWLGFLMYQNKEKIFCKKMSPHLS